MIRYEEWTEIGSAIKIEYDKLNITPRGAFKKKDVKGFLNLC